MCTGTILCTIQHTTEHKMFIPAVYYSTVVFYYYYYYYSIIMVLLVATTSSSKVAEVQCTLATCNFQTKDVLTSTSTCYCVTVLRVVPGTVVPVLHTGTCTTYTVRTCAYVYCTAVLGTVSSYRCT